MSDEKPRGNPIYGTDITRPLPELIEGLRHQLVQVRGQISDIQHHIGWRDRFDPVHGLLTCGISVLYGVKQEVEECLKLAEERRAKAAAE